MDKRDAVNGHDPDPKDALRGDSSDREVEAEVMFDQMDSDLGHIKLFDFNVGFEIEITVDDDSDRGEVAIAMMRLRGALINSLQMMQGGIFDLLSGGDFDPAMRLAVSTWGTGGRLMADGAIESIDNWLTENGLPTVSLYEVESSNIAAMGWADPHDADVPAVAVVAFEGGSLYAYDGVPEDLFSEWWHADSVGKYLNTEIKGRFPYRKLIG